MAGSFIDASCELMSVAGSLSLAGVSGVGRYYNYGAGSKVLTRQEARTLTANGVSIWVIFQYYGDKATWFDDSLGKKDAARALECACSIIGQPEGSAIYFGIDYDEDGQRYTSNIVPYFAAIRDSFRRNDGTVPYRIGVYGNGLVCRRLLDDGLVTETWLSCSTGYTEHNDFYASGRWSIAQTCNVPPVCGVDVDGDEVNPGHPDFGQFDHLGPLAPSHLAVATRDLHREFIENANSAEALEEDPARPRATEQNETADHDTARTLSNLGFTSSSAPFSRLRPAAAMPSATTINLDILQAQRFLDACIGAHPRVGYALGAKVPFPGAIPGIDFHEIDCSGFVREAILRAELTPLGFPDGSVLQHDWVRLQGFAKVSVAAAQVNDNVVRIAFLRPQDTQSRIGHVVLIYNGRTLESCAGVGPTSKYWTGSGWQARAYVYSLT